MKRKDKLTVYLESFLITVTFGTTFLDLHREIEKARLLEVYASVENDIPTLTADTPGVDIKVVTADKEMKESLEDDLRIKVTGIITPLNEAEIVSNNLSTDESKELLDEQFEEVQTNITAEIIPDASYSGMNVSHEYEDYIKGLCKDYALEHDADYNLLYGAMMTIGYRESAGKWDNNGIKSKTNDVGVFQINAINFNDAYDTFKYTEQDLRYDEYKNGKYAVKFVGDLITKYHCNNIREITGWYNGWKYWMYKKDAVNYANGCEEIYNTYFRETNTYQQNNTEAVWKK